MKAHDKFPHGKCECSTRMCECLEDPGPAAYSAMRDDGTILLCTMCWRDDDIMRTLLVTTDDDPDAYFGYDPDGALVISDEILGKEKIAELKKLAHIIVDNIMNVSECTSSGTSGLN